jgi:pimeloyl-ACP methyl ester carboxylesterase
MHSVISKAYIDTDRGQLHYRLAGTGTPLVLLQTLPLSGFMFEPLMAVLASRGYACYAIDPMGYGRSDPRREPWYVEDFAANLAQGLERLGITACDALCGHLTGMIATEMAIRFPGRIRRLVIDGAYAFTPEWVEERMRLSKPVAPWLEDGSHLVEHWQYLIGLLRRLDPELKLTSATQDQIAEAYFAFVTALSGPPQPSVMFCYRLEPNLRSLLIPVLLIGSPTDTARRWHERAREWLPQVSEHLFADINPLFQLNRPERAGEYADVIDRFLRASWLASVTP